MSKNNQGKRRGYRDPTPARGNRIRVRGKRLDQVDEDKIALAYWLLAKQLVEDQSEAAADGEGPAGAAVDDRPDADATSKDAA